LEVKYICLGATAERRNGEQGRSVASCSLKHELRPSAFCDPTIPPAILGVKRGMYEQLKLSVGVRVCISEGVGVICLNLKPIFAPPAFRKLHPLARLRTP